MLERLAARQAVGETTVAVQQVYPLERVQDAVDQFTCGTLGTLVVATD